MIRQGPRPSTGKSSSLTRPHTRPGDQGSDPLLRPTVAPERTPAGRHMCAVGGRWPCFSTPLCQVIHRLVCGLAPTCPKWPSRAFELSLTPGTGHFPWSNRVFGTERPIHPCGGGAPPGNLANNRCTRFSSSCGQPCAQSFCPGSRLLPPARKKFFRIICGVIHRATPKTVDNPVDNLWISAICLWVTPGPPVDKLLGHRITKPRSAVDNPGEICG